MVLSLSKKPETTTSKASSAETAGLKKSPKISTAGISNEVRSGALVTLSLAVLLGLLVLAGDFHPFSPAVNVPVLFNYIAGLESGSPVHLAGHKVGKVKAIQFLETAEGNKVLVNLTIDRSVSLKQDSEVFIDVLGFMGEKYVELTAGTPEAEPLPAGGTLTGTDPVPMMKIVKDGTELLADFRKTADSLESLTGDLQKIVGNNEQNLDQIFANLNEASANLKDMTHDLKLHPWKLLKKDKKKKFLIF